MLTVVYAVGGFNATAVNFGVIRTLDLVRGIATEFAADGSQTSRALTAAEGASLTALNVTATTATSSAESTLSSLDSQLAVWKTQLVADITAVTTAGWDVLTAQQRTAIMLRILNGFGTAMTATMDNAVVTGAITPS